MVEPVDPTALVPGQPLLRRYRRGVSTSWLQACRVVAADERGVFCWIPVGAGFAYRERPDGSPVRAAPIADFASAQLRLGGWQGRSALILMPPGRAHSVWWFFSEAGFSGWYVNLEARSRFWCHDGWYGVDVADHELDIVVAPDRSWQWKDEDDLVAVTGLLGYWDAHGSAEIRAEGRRVLADVEAARFPFDGSWCDFRPDPSWPTPRLPEPLPDFEWSD
ncbi:MAG TPA: DUF402 domain-containing protein [Jatrophihabitans sp.]|uniref:DUF402 domain-containing protein n=1 Tax=Jatrophihabitans sp. TaxID=1932789 RepID=UPI002F0D3E1A